MQILSGANNIFLLPLGWRLPDWSYLIRPFPLCPLFLYNLTSNLTNLIQSPPLGPLPPLLVPEATRGQGMGAECAHCTGGHWTGPKASFLLLAASTLYSSALYNQHE